jgi:glycine hydroxymethyltransferase
MDFLGKYFLKNKQEQRQKKVIAYLAALDHVIEQDPKIGHAIVQELKDQRNYLKLIASENFSSLTTQLAVGNLLTDKYSEGSVRKRFYAGCDNVDCVEELANQRLKQLFGAGHAYVQPHSGADANLVAFWAVLTQRIQNTKIAELGKKTVNELTDSEHEMIRQAMLNQKLMGMSIDSGGHLTHGFRMNVSAKFFHAVSYQVDPVTELLDYGALAKQVKQEKPCILIGGYSSYPRLLNFAKLREIADSVGAVLMGDIAHFSGLVAGKVLTGEYDPVPYCDIISSTTHKTLRGPRGGLVMCKEELKDSVDKGCPFILGGPLPHVIAAKAIAFEEALQPSFREYAKQVVVNAKALAGVFLQEGIKLFTSGTDNHLIVIDVHKSFGLTGRQAETALRQAHMTVNRNMVPFDKNGAWHTSGVRIGTPALTTLGMKEEQMREIGKLIIHVLKHTKLQHATGVHEVQKATAHVDHQAVVRAEGQVKDLLSAFPVYPELTLD